MEDSEPDLIEGLPVKRLFESFGAGGGHEPQPEPVGGWRGRVLGGYELKEEIDRGGMGIIFRAEQRALQRQVAVKVLRSGGFAGEDELARFQGEAEILGHLNHPNIVPIYDVGEDEGQPFIAMRWVEGGTLLGQVERCIEDPQLAVSILVKVGSAIHEAHRCGVLHRDLKPANVLVDQNDEPHVTDFGLSRRLDDENDLTRSRSIVGSPNYLAPEQISRDADTITTAVDVFGLGAILYHLLTGRPPFEGDSALGVLKKVEEADPDAPSSLNKRVDRDLETICLKCLRPNPQDRYRSAEAMVDDLKRWQRSEPISARPLSGIERLSRWTRRHPVRTTLVAVLMVAVVAGIALDAYYRINLKISRDKAIESQNLARQSNEQLKAAVIRLELERAEQEFANGRQRLGIERLLSVLEKSPLERAAANRLVHEWERRRFPLQTSTTIGVSNPWQLMDYSGDGKRVAAVANGSLHVWDVDSGELVMEPKVAEGTLVALQLNSDGSVVMAATTQRVRIWEVEAGRMIRGDADHTGRVRGAALSGDGKRLVVASRGMATAIDLSSDAELGSFRLGRTFLPNCFRLSPTGETLAVGGRDSLAWWDVSSGALLGESEAFTPSRVAFSGDGSRLVIANQNQFQVWDSLAREPLLEPVPCGAVIEDVALDADGDRCAIAFVVGRTEIYDSLTGTRWCEPILEPSHTIAIRFRPGTEWLSSLSTGGSLRSWDLDLEVAPPPDPSSYVTTFTAFDDAHKIRLQRSRGYGGQISTAETRRDLPIEKNVWHFALSPDGSEIALVAMQGGRGEVLLLDSDSLEVTEVVTTSDSRMFVEYSPDGDTLLVVRESGGMSLWDRQSKTVRLEVPNFPNPRKWAFSPDGTSLIASNRAGKIWRWSLETGKKIARLCDHGAYADGVDISSDGTLLLTGGLDSWFRWWKIEDEGNSPASLVGETQFRAPVNWVGFSPGGAKLFMAASRDGTARVWATDSMEQLCQIDAHELPLNNAYFANDGRHLITVSMDATIRIWDAETGHPVTSPLKHDEWWTIPNAEVPLANEYIEAIASQCRLEQ